MDFLKSLLITVLIYSFFFGLSCLLTCGIIKLITICFGWEFKWSIAIGVWLIIMLVKSFFRIAIKK